MTNVQIKLTEFSDLITRYTAGFVGREWLVEQVEALLDAPNCRFVVLTGGPGVGKTAFLAHLAATHPQWPRYFIRRDSKDLLRSGDANTFLLTIGGQLATLYPHLFHPENLEVAVRQRIGSVETGGEVTGARVEELHALPFYRVAILVEQEIGQVAGEATSVEIGRLVSEPRFLQMQDLQYLGLLDPAWLMTQQDPETRIVVLVDALDELRYSPAEPDILRVLRELPEIPPNLRFVISSRPEAFLGRLLARSDSCKLSLDVTGMDNWADLRAYAEDALTGNGLEPVLTKEGLSLEAFTDRLLDKAAGNFLYLKSVLSGIQEALSDPMKQDRLYHLLYVEELPDDLGALYGYFLASIVDWAERRGFGDGAWKKYLSPLLGVLAVAHEPLSEKQLIAFADLEPEDTRNLLRELRQFVEQVDDQQAAYRIYHTSFAEYLLDRERNLDYWIDGQNVHRCIAEHYLHNWGGLEAGLPALQAPETRDLDVGYGLRNLIAHLRAAGQRGTLFQTIEDPGWYAAKQFYDASRHSYALDVEQAIREAEAERCLPRVVAYSLLYATLRTMATNVLSTPEILEMMVHAGEERQALDYAASMLTPAHQSKAYWHIGLAFADQGKEQQAQDALAHALAAAQRMRNELDKAVGLSKIAQTMAQVKDRKGLALAIDAARETQWEYDKVEALCGVARALAQVSEQAQAQDVLEQARDAAVRVDSAYSKAKALTKVAQAMADLEEEVWAQDVVGQALDAAETFDVESSKTEVLIELCQIMAQVKHKEGLARAWSVAKSITEYPRLRARALSGVAQALTQIGDKGQARHVFRDAVVAVESMRDLDYEQKVKAFGEVAQAMARVGDQEALTEVLDAAERMDEWIAAWAKEEIVQAIAHVADQEIYSYSWITRWMDVDPVIDKAHRVVDWAMAHLNRIEGKREKRSRNSGRSDAGNDVVQDREELGRILAAAEWIPFPSYQAEALGYIAQAMALIGDRKGLYHVQTVAEGIEHQQAKTWALSRVAWSFTQIGDEAQARHLLNEALAAAEAIETKWMKVMESEGLREIAGVLSRVREFEDAVAVIEKIHYDEDKAEALGTVIPALAEAGERELLVRTFSIAKSLWIPWMVKAETFRCLAQAMAQVGDQSGIEDTLAAAEKIEDDHSRISAMSGIALALAQMGEHKRVQEMLEHVSNAAKGMESGRAKVLCEVARAKAYLGEEMEAHKILRRALDATGDVEYGQDKVKVLFDIAQAETNLGKEMESRQILMQALDATGWIRNEDDRIRALSRVVRALAHMGDAKGLNRALDIVEGGWGRSAEVLGEVARAMAQVGDRDGLNRALAVAEDSRLWLLGGQALGLSEVAKAMAQIGEREQAVRALERAQNNARSYMRWPMWDTKGEVKNLCVIAQALAQIGEATLAQDVVNQACAASPEIGDESKAEVLCAMAKALTQVGAKTQARQLLGQARDAAGTLVWDEDKASAMHGVAQAMIQLGEEIQAQETLGQAMAATDGIQDNIHDGGRKTQMLRAVARTLAQVTKPGNETIVSLCHQAFRAARGQERGRAWAYVSAFAPVLSALGGPVISETWERIQAVERLVKGPDS